jgi:hypothetical protein
MIEKHERGIGGDQVVASDALRIWLDSHDPTPDPAGWQISETGTVWTEVADRDGYVAQVVCLAASVRPLYLLAAPLADVEGLYTVETAPTLAGAQAIWEGYGS